MLKDELVQARIDFDRLSVEPIHERGAIHGYRDVERILVTHRRSKHDTRDRFDDLTEPLRAIGLYHFRARRSGAQQELLSRLQEVLRLPELLCAFVRRDARGGRTGGAIGLRVRSSDGEEPESRNDSGQHLRRVRRGITYSHGAVALWSERDDRVAGNPQECPGGAEPSTRQFVSRHGPARGKN